MFFSNQANRPTKSKIQNIDDTATLVELGRELGLDADEVKQSLEGTAYADDVKRDIAEAQYLGIQGVPFFVFNSKYAISGAQAVPVFEDKILSVAKLLIISAVLHCCTLFHLLRTQQHATLQDFAS